MEIEEQEDNSVNIDISGDTSSCRVSYLGVLYLSGFQFCNYLQTKSLSRLPICNNRTMKRKADIISNRFNILNR